MRPLDSRSASRSLQVLKCVSYHLEEKEIDITLVQGDNHMWHPNDCTHSETGYSLIAAAII